MNTLYVVCFIISLMGAVVRAAGTEEQTPERGRPIEVHESETQEGDEEVWAMETSARRETLYPSNWGHAGIFRVRSAESLPAGALTFGIGGEFYSVNDAPNLGSGSNARTLAESIFVGYAPTDNLSLALMRRSSSTTYGNPAQLLSSLGDINFSALYSFKLSPTIAIAPLFNILVASNFNSLTPSGNTLSASFGVASTFSLYPSTGIPLFLHANLIYSVPQIRGGTPIGAEVFYGFSRFNTVTLGFGAEYKLGDFIPFLEFYDTLHASSGLDFGSAPSKISIGTRFTPLENKSLAFLLGADVGLGRGLATGVPFSPSYQILGQVSYSVALSQTERKHYYTTSDVNVVDRKFVIKKNVNFKVGSAEIEPESKKLLDQIAEVIERNKIKKLLIVGHTDSSHSDEYNLKLSVDRANAVKKHLVSRGVAEEKLMAQGYGRRKPKATNSTESGRALNRRVEFLIVD